MQKLLELAIGGLGAAGERRQAPRMPAHFVARPRRPRAKRQSSRALDQSRYQPVHQPTHDLLEALVLGGAGELAFRLFVPAIEFRHRPANVVDAEQTRRESIVQVGTCCRRSRPPDRSTALRAAAAIPADIRPAPDFRPSRNRANVSRFLRGLRKSGSGPESARSGARRISTMRSACRL